MTDRTTELLGLMLSESQDREAILSSVLEIAQSLREETLSLGNYWHPLGMLRLRLAKLDDYLLKVHIWPQGVRGPTSPVGIIHAHIWPLKSYILYGSVTNTIYHVSDATREKATNRLYRTKPTGTGLEQVLAATDDYIICNTTSIERQTEGTFYDVPLDQYHATTVALEDYAATVFLTSKVERPNASIVGPKSGDEVYNDPRQPCDDLVFTQLFDAFIAILSAKIGDIRIVSRRM